EFRMQVRKRAVWLVPGLTILVLLLIGSSLLRDLFDPVEGRTEAKAAIVVLGGAGLDGAHRRPGDAAGLAARRRLRPDGAADDAAAAVPRALRRLLGLGQPRPAEADADARAER